MTDVTNTVARRSILARFGIGAAAIGSGMGISKAVAATNTKFEPVLHPEDSLFDSLPGRHRFVIDSTPPEADGIAWAFDNNYYEANNNGYKLDAPATAVV